MSYIKKLITVFQNRNKIWEGIKYSFFPNSYVESVAKKRLIICADCPEIDLVGTKCFVPGTAPCCGQCGCKLKWKSRALSEECPLQKWLAEMTIEQEEEFRQKTNIVNE